MGEAPELYPGVGRSFHFVQTDRYLVFAEKDGYVWWNYGKGKPGKILRKGKDGEESTLTIQLPRFLSTTVRSKIGEFLVPKVESGELPTKQLVGRRTVAAATAWILYPEKVCLVLSLPPFSLTFRIKKDLPLGWIQPNLCPFHSPLSTSLEEQKHIFPRKKKAVSRDRTSSLEQRYREARETVDWPIIGHPSSPFFSGSKMADMVVEETDLEEGREGGTLYILSPSPFPHLFASSSATLPSAIPLLSSLFLPAVSANFSPLQKAERWGEGKRRPLHEGGRGRKDGANCSFKNGLLLPLPSLSLPRLPVWHSPM